MKRNLVRLIVAGLLMAAWGGYFAWERNQIWHKRKAQKPQCISNLKQIYVGFRLWESDHGDQFPFNVSTNTGGTVELCAPDRDGFDRNAYRSLQVMSNELTVPKLLVCPRDKSRKVATNWAGLRPENITYRFHCGTNIIWNNPKAVLAVCPMDGNVLYADGTIKGEPVVNEDGRRALEVSPDFKTFQTPSEDKKSQHLTNAP